MDVILKNFEYLYFQKTPEKIIPGRFSFQSDLLTDKTILVFVFGSIALRPLNL